MNTETHTPEYTNFRQWLITNAPYCASKQNFPNSCISESEYFKLRDKYSKQQIVDIIELIENRKDLRGKYSNLYRTVGKWAKTEYGN